MFAIACSYPDGSDAAHLVHDRIHKLLVEGLIHLHTNRYSVDEALIGRRVQVRET
jgi:hypothetical protein